MNLKNLRKKAGLTRLDLSKKLNCHKQQIYNWEIKNAPIPSKYISDLSNVLNINEKALINFIVSEYKLKITKKD